MPLLTFSSGMSRTATEVASDPVPAVVGTATSGLSGEGGFLPPPTEPSNFPSSAKSAACWRDSAVGSAYAWSNTSCWMPSSSSDSTTWPVTPASTTLRSVTTIALSTPRRLSSHPVSRAAPGPNFIGVASSVKTCSLGLPSLTGVLLSSTSPRELPVAELAAQDLAGRRLGQLVDHLDQAGVLVGGHALLAERDERIGVHLLPRLEAHERLDRLAAVLVGHSDHGGLTHRWMGHQRVLDLPRPDLVPGDVDLVLAAIDQIEPAFLVHQPHVAGVEPAVRDRLLRLLGLLPVARHDLGSAGHELANLAWGKVVPLVADDADHRARDRHAHRQRAGALVHRRPPCERHGVGRRCRLGQPVDVVDVGAGQLLERLDGRRGDRRAARVDLGERR